MNLFRNFKFWSSTSRKTLYLEILKNGAVFGCFLLAASIIFGCERNKPKICPITWHGVCEYRGKIMFVPDQASPEFWREVKSAAPDKYAHQSLGVEWPCEDHKDFK